MLTKFLFQAVFLATSVLGKSSKPHKNGTLVAHDHIAIPKLTRKPAAAVPLISQQINGKLVATNTTTANTLVAVSNAAAVAATSVNSTVLVFVRDVTSGYSAYSGLLGYAIPYQVVAVPQAGITLPTLNSSVTHGNYGAIIILSEVSYDYGGTEGFGSALTDDQWATIYQYQASFGVRMVRLDVYPGEAFGTSAIGGCCDDTQEQVMYISDASTFPTANLKTGTAANVSTLGLYHYPATITDDTIATPFALFAPTAGFPTTSTAGVINNINGAQQMVFFTSFGTEWSQTSNYLQHAFIHWVTRGLYTGYRRVYFNTQVDDMFLESDIYSPNGTTYQVTTSDLAIHKTWMTSVNARMPAGSNYIMEICHNGNGNIETAEDVGDGTQCGIGSIEYNDQIDTPLEFMKPLGTGTSIWPATPLAYPTTSYTTKCTRDDPLLVWWTTAANLNAFSHVSHTFTHEDQDNATYSDVYREINWNQAWLNATGIAKATRFSSKGLVPPAITGLHNGDALQAWLDNGIVNVVGDNTRPVLMNQINEHWPLISTVAANGYAGIQINPRWATNIYYNCAVPDCTVLEWINTSAGDGDFYTLLGIEKQTNTRHLLSLHHDPYMFHQANLNHATAPKTTINGVTAQLSLFQTWVETVFQEMVRLTTWPMISLKHDDMAAGFASRMARDFCAPSLAFTANPTAKTITGVTVTTIGNTCSALIPVTVPGKVTSTQGFTTEQIGSDPLTIWVKMAGSPVTFTLTTPIPF